MKAIPPFPQKWPIVQWSLQKTFQKLLLCLLCTFFCHTYAKGAVVNLVVNGEFENPDFVYAGFPNTLPGWTLATPGVTNFEIWDEGILGSPSMGSDGLGTGQHLELNGPDTPFIQEITQSFFVPNGATLAEFSFDAWLRPTGPKISASYSVTGSISGALIPSTPMTLNSSSWVLHEHSLSIIPGETITLSFVGNSEEMGGVHIDDVHFLVTVPEPSTVILSFSSLLLLFHRRCFKRERR